ncbi:MAG: T9SS C-terminal target domain-containing protein, partial [Bacteroidetes bacterium]
YEFVNIVFSNPINARTENGRALIGSLDTYPCRAEPVPTYIEGNSLNLQAAVPNQQGILLSRPAPTNTRMVEYIMQLNKPYPEMVSVAYRTADNSAKAGLDYVAKSGVVTFAPNQTSATIMLEIITDDVQEIPQREGFFLILTQPNKLGCNGPEQYAAIFIMDDDNGTPRGLRSAVRANDVNPTATSTSKIWPNPVQSRLNVTLNAPQNENVTLQLVNAQGKIVKQMNTQVQSKLGNALTIGVGDLPQGLYKLLVTGQTFRETRSVMIQR